MPGFKPMVKMMTTEPSVELKLKKGGKVEKKMQQGGPAMDSMSAQDSLPMSAREGMMPARGGMMPAKRPKRPSLMARRRAMRGMPTGAGPAAPVGDAARMAEATAPAMMPEPPMGQPMMKKGGKMSKLNKEIRNESEEIGRVKAKLTKHEDKAASKAHKGLKTGGVVMGQGGYKKGGEVKMAKGGSSYEEYSDHGNVIKTKSNKTTEMKTAHRDNSPAKTGGVKMGNAGGYKTGGVVKGQGGYKKGGMADGGKMPMKDGKPAFLEKGMMAGGGMHMMPDGSMMKDSAMKMGGKTSKKAFAAGGTVDSGKPVAMPQGRKKPSPPVLINQYAGTYKKGGSVTPAEGRLQKMFKKENASAMKAAKADSNEVYSKYGKTKMADGGSVNEKGKPYQSEYFRKFLEGKGIDEKMIPEMSDLVSRPTPKEAERFKKMLEGAGNGAVTETEKSITVAPAKKRGGAMRRGGGVC
jgi:hypothetical protein